MPSIRVVDFTGTLIDELFVNKGVTFADAAMSKWPDGFEGTTPVVYDPNGDRISSDDAVTVPMEFDDVWTIRLLPQGPAVVGFLSTYWLQIATIALSAAATYLLAPKIPDIQNSQSSYQWDDSDTPQWFSGQQNRVQPGRRIPELFGKIRTYPDLMSSPAIEYKGNNQTVREMYVVGNGKVVPTDLKFHDESYETIPGSAYKVYYPGSKWPADFPIMRNNPAVGTVELPAPNETLSFGLTYQIGSNRIFVDQADYWETLDASSGQWFMLAGVSAENRKPQQVDSVSADGKSLFIKGRFPKNETISTGSVDIISLDYVSASGTTPRTYNVTWKDYFETYEVGEGQREEYIFTGSVVDAIPPYPSNGTLVSQGSQADVNCTIYANKFKWPGDKDDAKPTGNFWFVQKSQSGSAFNPSFPGSGYASEIYQIPGEPIEAWLDFEFPGGLYEQKAGEPPRQRRVQIVMKHRIVGQTDDQWFTTTYSFTDKTRTPRRFTVKKIFPSAKRRECYIERITDMTYETQDIVVQDAVRWIGLHGRQSTPELLEDTLNCTLLEVTLQSQSLANAGQQRRVNLVGRRRFFSYLTNKWEYTRTIYDAIMYTLVQQGGIPRDNIDEVTLRSIQDDIEAMGPRQGEFNGVIDQTMTVEDQATMIAGAGRINIYRRGSKIFFSRMKGGLQPTTLINARNKVEPENRGFAFSERNEPDGIILRYRNEDNDYREATLQWPENVTLLNADEQSIIGLTNADAIARMAKYQWNKRTYERDTIGVSMMEEGILLSPGDVIAVTDYLREDPPIEGEIVDINGSSVTFDQVVPVGVYNAILRDQLGDIYHRGTVNIVSESNVQNISAWSGAVPPTTGNAQTGLLYSLTIQSTDYNDLFYVTRVAPTREGPVNVEGLLYRQETYAGDIVAASEAEAVKRILPFEGTAAGAQNFAETSNQDSMNITVSEEPENG